MTYAEKKLERNEWLKSLKVGDEVCVTNEGSISSKLFSTMMGGIMGGFFGGPTSSKEDSAVPQLICGITKVRAVLPDGHLLIENGMIFTLEGVVENVEGTAVQAAFGAVEIWPADDKNKDIAWRLQFHSAISKFGWEQWKLFSRESIEKMIDIINSETLRIEDEKKAEEQARKEAAEKAEEEKRANGFPYMVGADYGIGSSLTCSIDNSGELTVGSHEHTIGPPEETIQYPKEEGAS